jgi:hypothetical protein
MLSAHFLSTKWYLEPLFDRLGQAGKHFVGATHPVDLGETARFPVEINEGLGLGLVEVKTLVDGVRGVIVTLDDVSPTVVAGPGAGLGAGGLEVGATVAADATGRKTGENEVTRHHKVDHNVEGACLGDGVQRDGLGHCARESVKDVPTVASIIGLDALLDETNHDVVADKVASIDHSLGHATKLCALADGGAQHVASGDVGNDKVTRQTHTLRALTRTLATQQN